MLRRMNALPKTPIKAWLPYLLGFLTAVGALSTDFYLPAFTMIEAEFHRSHGSAQITLATWFLGFACGQMIQGATTDWLGRRRPLLVGTALYAAASLGCAFAPGMATLALCRFFAAIGGAASSVIPRAVVRDHADGHAAAGIMAQLTLVMGAAPILAPTLGGFLLKFVSWRALFGICTGYGLIGLGLVYFFLPETLPPKSRHAVDVAAAARRYAGILREPNFAAHVFMSSAAMFTIFSFVAGSPALILAYHISPARLGSLLMLAAIPYITAAQLNPRLLALFGTDRVIRTAVTVAAVAGLSLFAAASLWHLTLPVLMGFVMVNAFGIGLIMPNSSISALSRHARSAGSASALAGTLNFLSVALCSSLGGMLANGTVRPIAEMLVCGTVPLLAAQWVRVRVRARLAREIPNLA